MWGSNCSDGRLGNQSTLNPEPKIKVDRQRRAKGLPGSKRRQTRRASLAHCLGFRVLGLNGGLSKYEYRLTGVTRRNYQNINSNMHLLGVASTFLAGKLVVTRANALAVRVLVLDVTIAAFCQAIVYSFTWRHTSDNDLPYSVGALENPRVIHNSNCKKTLG